MDVLAKLNTAWPLRKNSVWTDSKSTKTAEKSWLCETGRQRQLHAESWQCTSPLRILNKTVTFCKENAPVDPQCSYSPDLFPEASPFVPKFKETSQMIPFRNNKNIQKNVTDQSKLLWREANFYAAMCGFSRFESLKMWYSSDMIIL